MSNFSIVDHWNAGKVYIMAEVAQSHDGSLGMAHSFIDAAKQAGADAIKFQTHFASEESTAKEEWRVKFSKQDASRYDYWKRMEFTPDQWVGLKEHADEVGIHFLSSPFSIKAVELLDSLGVHLWKIASGELSNLPMLEAIYQTGKPVIYSSGMSQVSELDTLVEHTKLLGIPFAILQCTTAYPTPPEKIGLNVMEMFKERYGSVVGFSDHSGQIYPGLASATLGGQVIEVHLALSKDMFGPDVSSSLDTQQFSELVKGVRFIEKMRQSPIDKDTFASEMKPMRNLFTKSIVSVDSLPEGTVLQIEHLAYKKPGLGIPASKYRELLGKTLKHAVTADHFFAESDFE